MKVSKRAVPPELLIAALELLMYTKRSEVSSDLELVPYKWPTDIKAQLTKANSTTVRLYLSNSLRNYEIYQLYQLF